METKYYIPTIEEFSQGLEYEMFDFDNEKYIKCVMTWEDFYWPVVYNQISSKHCRVKCLDKEDIEGGGWTHDPTPDLVTYSFIRPDNSFLIYAPMTNFVLITITDRNTNYEHVVFEGKIKNKSELKRLMKQLGI